MKHLKIRDQLKIITHIPILCLAVLLTLVYECQYHHSAKQHIIRIGKAYLSQMLMLAQLQQHTHPSESLQTLLDSVNLNPEIKSGSVLLFSK